MVDLNDWRTCCVVAYLDEPPYFMPVGGADPIGCDIELAKVVLADLGIASIEFVLTTFAELIDGVRTHRWHINVPMFITPERSQRIAYSLPVWAATDSFIVRSTDQRDFTSYESIAADDTIRLAAVTGQIQLDTALAVGVPSERIVEFTDQDAAATAVLEDRVDASVSTAPGNFAYVERRDDPRITTSVDTLAADRGAPALGAFSFHPQAHELRHQFDAALRRFLGTPAHLDMVGAHGFTRDAVRPALAVSGIDTQ